MEAFKIKYRTDMRGFSLAELMLAILVMMTIFAGVARSATAMLKTRAQLANTTDLELLRLTLREQISCRETLKPASLLNPVDCRAISSVTFRRADGSQLPTKFGSPAVWEVRGKCDNNQLAIEVHALGGGGVTPGAIDGKTGLRNDWFDLFNGMNPGFCSAYFSGAQACPHGQSVIGMVGPLPVCGR